MNSSSMFTLCFAIPVIRNFSTTWLRNSPTIQNHVSAKIMAHMSCLHAAETWNAGSVLRGDGKAHLEHSKGLWWHTGKFEET